MSYDDLPNQFDLAPDTGGLLTMYFKGGDLYVEILDEEGKGEAFLELDDHETRFLHADFTSLVLGGNAAILVEVGGEERIVSSALGGGYDFNIVTAGDDEKDATYRVRMTTEQALLTHVRLTTLILAQGMEIL